MNRMQIDKGEVVLFMLLSALFCYMGMIQARLEFKTPEQQEMDCIFVLVLCNER